MASRRSRFKIAPVLTSRRPQNDSSSKTQEEKPQDPEVVDLEPEPTIPAVPKDSSDDVLEEPFPTEVQAEKPVEVAPPKPSENSAVIPIQAPLHASVVELPPTEVSEVPSKQSADDLVSVEPERPPCASSPASTFSFHHHKKFKPNFLTAAAGRRRALSSSTTGETESEADPHAMKSLLELQPTTPAEIEQPDTTFSFANMNSVPTEGPATPTPAVVTHERKETKLTTWKREAEEKVAKGVPIQDMMMRDIISMNPMPKPMFGGLLSKKSKSLWSANKISIPRVAERPQEQDNPGLPAPRVKIAPDGSIVVDEESLVVETSAQKRTKALQDSEAVHLNSDRMYRPLRKKTAASRKLDWSGEKTKKFYEALSTVGTDFSLMSQLLPSYDRRELLRKYKSELARRPQLVMKALEDSFHFDLSRFTEELDSPDEDAQAKEAQKLLGEKRKRPPDAPPPKFSTGQHFLFPIGQPPSVPPANQTQPQAAASSGVKKPAMYVIRFVPDTKSEVGTPVAVPLAQQNLATSVHSSSAIPTPTYVVQPTVRESQAQVVSKTATIPRKSANVSRVLPFPKLDIWSMRTKLYSHTALPNPKCVNKETTALAKQVLAKKRANSAATSSAATVPTERGRVVKKRKLSMPPLIDDGGKVAPTVPGSVVVVQAPSTEDPNKSVFHMFVQKETPSAKTSVPTPSTSADV